ncbi:MAG: hypothetical protein C3F15_12315 [Holophagae bacterium]|nr:MAG: hypothetical protein C3F15_12315 [Holophagae bacterium]
MASAMERPWVTLASAAPRARNWSRARLNTKSRRHMTADGNVGDSGFGHEPGEPTVDLPGGFLAPGQVLGDRYQIRSQLGRGGMGEVWRAFDLKLRVEVALKALRQDLFADERRRELLRSEVRAAREVVSPNVCRVFDLIEIDGRELVSMEYVDGQTLLHVLQERGPLELKEAQDIASQFLAGLEAIHKAGLVHRDVKPENIMLTRAGRVVVMDFGLARQEAAEAGGTVSGTPAYMAPEQAAGLKVDARADVYSAGVVLAEMVSPEGIKSLQSRQSVWEGIRHEPARVPESPWAPVLKKAVAKEPAARYHSAHTLTRALEDVTLRVEGAEDLHPYPGLASFTEADAEYFFGREAEVEQMWARLEGPARLLGLVGPSGAGKSSFVRAGLIPSARAGWAFVLCTPGADPRAALRRAVILQLEGDSDALRELAEGSDDASVSALVRWRRRHAHAVVIIDQFEELFTQNSGDEQTRFAELLGRLVLEADAFVLLTMRDDFAVACHTHEPLRPMFHELTVLDPPRGASLRRALTQPALQCGYRFEDDALVEEMLGEVEGERGALPMLAFAAARLWEKRDREAGLLTRQAYHDIGGVGGALARHAEATMGRIGPERVGIVREIFRNLVTAEGTRAVRERDELLSVFADSQRESAREVLRALVDARLLTTYEVKEEEREATRRVEIIHESLLASWPRLVRWQTQDADAAQLRDQLRQAARTWNEHGRTDDMLWTGSAFREYAVWRERYPGGLTELEEAFAGAMTSLATRRRRRRRIAAASALALAVVVAAVFGALWRRSVQETRRAEAAKLLALGQLRLTDHPNAALAYAIASLERADNEGARRFAVEALWQGPPAFFLSGPQPWSVAWSPDGRWLALGGGEGVDLLERDTGAARRLSSKLERTVGFTSDGRRLVTDADEGAPPTKLNVWALPEGRLERTLGHAEASPRPWLVADRLLTFAHDEPTPEGRRSHMVRELPLDGAPEKAVAVWESNGLVDWDIDPTATWILSLQRGRLVQQRLDDLSAPGRLIGAHEGEATVWMRPWRDRIVTGDSTGEVQIWDVPSARLERTLRSPREATWIALDPRERYVAAAPGSVNLASPPWLFLFDLAAPRAAAPAGLPTQLGVLNDMQFSPDGSWLATVHNGNVILWNLVGTRSIVLGREKRVVMSVIFTPDGDLLSASGGDGMLRRWPLSSVSESPVQELMSRPGTDLIINALDPAGSFVVVNPGFTDEFVVVPLDGSPATSYRLTTPEGVTVYSIGVSVEPGARFLAISIGTFGHPEPHAIRIVDLETGQERTLDTLPKDGEGCEEPGSEMEGWAVPVSLADGRLLSDGDGGLRLWDLASGTSRQLWACRKLLPSGGGDTRATPDSRTVVRLNMSVQVGEASSLSAFDLVTSTTREITSHGNRLVGFVLDRTGKTLVTQDMSGVIRVGPLTGEEPHLLYGHSGAINTIAVSPDGRWIASGSEDGTIRLWPMPDLSKPPLHTLPHDELLAKLKSLTNLRAVPDPGSDTGWKVEVGPFPGWATVPEWNP